MIMSDCDRCGLQYDLEDFTIPELIDEIKERTGKDVYFDESTNLYDDQIDQLFEEARKKYTLQQLTDRLA